MKFLVFGEYGPEDAKATFEEDAILRAERERHPGKYPKITMDVCLLGADLPKLTEGVKWVGVGEVDDPKQLADDQAYWLALQPDVKTFKTWVVPLTEFNEALWAEVSQMQQLFEKRKEQLKTTQ